VPIKGAEATLVTVVRAKGFHNDEADVILHAAEGSAMLLAGSTQPASRHTSRA